jgi:hypothetical protein
MLSRLAGGEPEDEGALLQQPQQQLVQEELQLDDAPRRTPDYDAGAKSAGPSPGPGPSHSPGASSPSLPSPPPPCPLPPSPSRPSPPPPSPPPPSPSQSSQSPSPSPATPAQEPVLPEHLASCRADYAAFLPGIYEDLLLWAGHGIDEKLMDTSLLERSILANQPGIAIVFR